MKKPTALFAVLLLCAALLLCVALLCGCGGKPVKGAGQNAELLVSENSIDENLRYFLGITGDDGTTLSKYGNMGDRTPTSESERNAANKLWSRYADKDAYPYFDALDINKTTFEVKVGSTMRMSQNVVVRFVNPNRTDNRQVVIGASYDNPYGSYEEEFSELPSTGAITATGVATVMSLIDWCNTNADAVLGSTDFDIVFVFYGCGSYNYEGANAFITETMTAEERADTLLAVDFDKLGGERMYLYADEVSTPHEEFLLGVAATGNIECYTLPANMPIIDGIYREGLYYTHFAMIGNNTPFLEWDIPAAHIFSGYYGGVNLSYLEKRGDSNYAGTEYDTYDNLQSGRSDYAAQGSTAASLIASAVTSPGFGAASDSSKQCTKSNSGSVNPLWAHITVLGIIIVLGVVVVVLVKHYEKKYPFKPIVRRMKIAVFGMDYETKTEEDIFIDIKRRPRNPFDGY